jgi:hypothetical protein
MISCGWPEPIGSQYCAQKICRKGVPRFASTNLVSRLQIFRRPLSGNACCVALAGAVVRRREIATGICGRPPDAPGSDRRTLSNKARFAMNSNGQGQIFCRKRRSAPCCRVGFAETCRAFPSPLGLTRIVPARTSVGPVRTCVKDRPGIVMAGQIARRIGTAVAKFDFHVPPPGRPGQKCSCRQTPVFCISAIKSLFSTGTKGLVLCNTARPDWRDLRRSGAIAQLY